MLQARQGKSEERTRCFILLVMLTMLAGCAATHRPPPESVYAGDYASLFDDVHPSLQRPAVDMLYATDRARDAGDGSTAGYSDERSYALVVGEAQVAPADDITWDELKSWTLSSGKPRRELFPQVTSSRELVAFPRSPIPYALGSGGRMELDPVMLERREQAAAVMQEELRSRLALSKRKEVLVFVHGVGTSFNTSIVNSARLWHMIGRVGVPLAYTWPAGEISPFFYTSDRESGEFTVFHLKQLLRDLSAEPAVEKIHILAHSRGTDVASTAVRELFIEARAKNLSPREHLKIGNLVLVAADIDIDVFSQRFVAERLEQAVGRLTIYANDEDTAIQSAQLLFNSRVRLGQVTPEDLSDYERAYLASLDNLDIIFYQGDKGGVFRHLYFNEPVMLADLLLLVVGGAPPGAANGRPLESVGQGMWRIPEGYPGVVAAPLPPVSQ